ncbi:protein kinase [Streptomyces sp. NPDC087908]|uniref:protein kinase n=1 Tax=Streptomyces sp. NPDC087908 TaxID=3365820 RepID=UPI0038096FD7
MDDYAGRVLADRYRLPLPPADAEPDAYDPAETRAFDTYSGQEVLVRRVPLPEFVDAEVLDGDGDGGPAGPYGAAGRATRRPAEPVVRRAIEAAQAAAQIPDHPLLDQVFDVFAEAGSLWIVSERIAARPLAALLAERPLNPYRAAEIGADVLTALRALHAHGWVHRNITARTVLVCDDGRVVLTGLAVGAAEEALCGYAPEPEPEATGWQAPAEEYGEEDGQEYDEAYDHEYGEASGSGDDDTEEYDSEPYEAEVYEEADGNDVPYRADEFGTDEYRADGYRADGYRAEQYGAGERGADPYGADEYGADRYGAAPGATDDGPPEAPAGTGGERPEPAPPAYGYGYGGGYVDEVRLPGQTRYLPEPAPRPRDPEQDHGQPGLYRSEPEPDHVEPYPFRTDPEPDHIEPDLYRSDPAPDPYRTDPEPDHVDSDPYQAEPDQDRAGSGPRAPATGQEDTPSAASPYGTGPGGYGTDPYGRALPAAPAAETQPAAAPPTADVRAARAGAIAAYRAGARAAAKLGETGNLPAQRPAPTDPTPAPPPPPPEPTAQASGAPEPQWWARVADDDEDDEDDGDEPYGGGPQAGPPPRVMLAGNWSDGPHASRDGSPRIPAGGSGPGRGPVLPGSGRPALPAGYKAATTDPGRLPVPAGDRETALETALEPAVTPDRARSDRGPTTRLAAERARHTRIAVVGAVTERWAPEQAGPVHENWRLAPPIGPATDLWALGALLYRAVQGHAPYPEDSAAELVQLVCAEPPAFAEECGPLRPVVESLLRQDPTERPDFEELRGWLRSLVRSAPEPDAGVGVVPLPSFDETRLPIVRRRGELVRRRRGAAGAGRHRHRRRGKDARLPDRPYDRHEELPAKDFGVAPAAAGVREEYREDFPESYHEEIPQRASRSPRAPRAGKGPRAGRPPGSPRSLGRTLLVLVFLLLGGAVAYAVLFMPRDGETPAGSASPSGAPRTTAPANPPSGTTPPATRQPTSAPATPRTTPPAADPSGPALAAGYALRQDPEGFRIGVPNGWRRSPLNDAGQVRYTSGDFTMIVVPGRDTVSANGSDPLEYQSSRERELEPARSSSWGEVQETRLVTIGTTVTATGSYLWPDSTGRMVFVRNLAMIHDGRYHVVQVIGPKNDRSKISEIFDEATKGFRPGR